MTDAGPVLVTARSARDVTGVMSGEAALLYAVFVVVVVPVAVLDSPLVTPAPTCATSVNVALAPAASEDRVRVTAPLPPTAGVVEPKDCPLSCASETKVDTLSLHDALPIYWASLEPLFATVTV